jgi:PAS domain S-box-containing protein
MAHDPHWSSQAPSSSAPVALTAVFESLGRVLIGLDREFRIVHVSGGIGKVLGVESGGSLLGRSVASLLGEESFGSGGLLRDALERGERRDGWRISVVPADGSTRLVSCSVAPYRDDVQATREGQIAFVVLLQPAEELVAAAQWMARLSPGRMPDVTDPARRPAEVLRAALEQHRWQREATARALGISRTTLWRKMREAGMLDDPAPVPREP